jgi:hypothetical protein
MKEHSGVRQPPDADNGCGPPVSPDFEFSVGRNRLTGSGWRGLIALGLFLGFAAAIFLVSANTVLAPAARQAFPFVHGLLH